MNNSQHDAADRFHSFDRTMTRPTNSADNPRDTALDRSEPERMVITLRYRNRTIRMDTLSTEKIRVAFDRIEAAEEAIRYARRARDMWSRLVRDRIHDAADAKWDAGKLLVDALID